MNPAPVVGLAFTRHICNRRASAISWQISAILSKYMTKCKRTQRVRSAFMTICHFSLVLQRGGAPVACYAAPNANISIATSVANRLR